MKKIFILIFAMTLSLYMTSALSSHKASLENQRIDALIQYVTLLGEGDYHILPELFTSDATVVSSSGITDIPGNFYKKLFTQTISMHSTPKTELIDILPGILDKNKVAVYFNFSWTNEKNERISAKFLDLFIFEPKSEKIKNVFVFGNTFQDDIMKQ